MNATTCADSSFLVSLVCSDTRSDDAHAYMQSNAEPLIFTPLHCIETRNAIRNSAGRGEITEEQLRAALRDIDDDLREGFFVHCPVNWVDTFRRADALSAMRASTEGQRTIDLLHIAIALESGAKTFFSFDARQRKLAKAVGLKVKP